MFHCWTDSFAPLAELAKEKIFWQSLGLLVEVRKELEGKQCFKLFSFASAPEKALSWSLQLPGSTEVFWCLFSMFILFKITNPNFFLCDYRMESQHGTCPVRLWLLSCMRMASSRCLWRNQVCCWVRSSVWGVSPARTRQAAHTCLNKKELHTASRQELRINPRSNTVEKLNTYSMDQRNSYAAGNCNSSAPHWIII